MPEELLKYIIVVVLAGLLSLSLCIFALKRLRNSPGGKPYIFVTLLSSLFTFAYAFELSSSNLDQIKFWLHIEYLAMPIIPTFVLLMCFEYIGQKLKQWAYYTLFAIPIITIFMHDTNSLHHLYYTSMKLREDTPFPILKLEYGPWFYVHSLYLFMCLMISMIILLKQLKKSLFRFQMQILLMVTGLALPIIANHFYLNGLSPYGIDLGPVSMSISFVLHGAALVSFQMFNVAPIARDTVFENMKLGVIVINQKGVIVDYNRAILNVLPMLNQQVIGKELKKVIAENEQLLNIIHNQKASDYELEHNDEISHFNIRFSSVRNKNNLIIGQIITFTNVTERLNMQIQLQQLASMDGLTQVFNRTFFIKEFEILIEPIKINGGSTSVIMFDIDHYKPVNDTYGHEAGDQVLINIAKLAKETIREKGIVGRYGGEEFIICLPYTPLTKAIEIAESIRMKVSEHVTIVDGREVYVTSSFGITSATEIYDEYGQSIQKLMKEADYALYDAKHNGRNRVELFKQTIEYSSVK